MLQPLALVSVFAETPSEASVNTLAPELLFQMPISRGSFPGVCFCVKVFEAHFSSLWNCSFLSNVSKAQPSCDAQHTSVATYRDMPRACARPVAAHVGRDRRHPGGIYFADRRKAASGVSVVGKGTKRFEHAPGICAELSHLT